MTKTFCAETQLAIADLFNRYVHAIDCHQTAEWVSLFTDDGVFEVPGSARLQGPEQLAGMVAMVADLGKGKWRHQITNLVVDRGDSPDSASIRAYGLLTDWNNGGALAAFTDYRGNVVNIDGQWKIAELTAWQAGSPPA